MLEEEKRQAGEVYDATGAEFMQEINRVKGLCARYNAIDPEDTAERDRQIRAILGSAGENVTVIQPFHCDWGRTLHLGNNVFINAYCTVLDDAEVRIGNNCFIGPNVSIYTPCHPLRPEERNRGLQWCKPVTIGNDCWLGGSVTILPGVTIGAGTTIGAGSVVVSDIPAGVVAVGNPCRVVRAVE